MPAWFNPSQGARFRGTKPVPPVAKPLAVKTGERMRENYRRALADGKAPERPAQRKLDIGRRLYEP